MKFGIFCIKCRESSKPHIVWHEQRAFTFICYNCGAIEVCKLDAATPPLNTEEYDKIRKENEQKLTEDADKIIEKRLN